MSSIPVTFDPEAALERWQKLNFTRQRAHVEAVERAKKPENTPAPHRRRGREMYALVVILLHVGVSGSAALAIAPYAVDPAANSTTLWVLAFASAMLSTVGVTATAGYLSKHLRIMSGVKVGLLCGVLCGAILSLAAMGIDYSLIVYLALLAPTLLAVLLAVLLDRSKSGWQPLRPPPMKRRSARQ